MWNANDIKGLAAGSAGEGGRALRGACPVLAGSRIVDQRWVKGSSGLDRAKCGGARPGGAGDGLYHLKDLQRGTIVNEIERAYNGFAQLTGEYQSHSGAVSPSTTPQVQYAYTNGSANHVHRTSMTYPGGEGLQYNYGGGSNADNALNRLHSLRRDGTTLAHYRYLGQERVVIADYSGKPEIELTYFASGQSGEAGDPYVGLDRGACPVLAGRRVIDQRWRRTGDDSDVDGVKCDGACPGGAGNAASNRQWMRKHRRWQWSRRILRGSLSPCLPGAGLWNSVGSTCPVKTGNSVSEWEQQDAQAKEIMELLLCGLFGQHRMKS